MSRLSSVLLAGSLFAAPLVALAAPLDAAGVIASVVNEKRPVNFSYAITQDMPEDRISIAVNGATEGAAPDKMWVKVTFDLISGDEQLKSELEMRVKQGMIYYSLRDVSGSPSMLSPELVALKGKWYGAKLPNPCNCWSLKSMPDPVMIGSMFDLNIQKFQTGYSYQLLLKPEALDQLLAIVGRAGLASISDVQIKMDTNTAGAFQYASFKIGSLLQGKVQRQFHAVYVETPKTDGELPAGFFEMLLGQSVPQQPVSAVTPAPQTASSSPAVSAAVRRTRRTSETAILDLHGPDGINLKLTAKVVTTPVRWSSASAFREDFKDGRGILYRYARPVTTAFSGKGAYGPIDIVFFDQSGRFVSSGTIPACNAAGCKRIEPDKPFLYALELKEGSISRHGIDPLWRLSLDWLERPATGADAQAADRLSARARRERQSVYVPPALAPSVSDDYVHLKILGETTVQKIRLSDVLAAGAAVPDHDAARRIYQTLADTVKQTQGVRYIYVVLPAEEKDTFALVVDNFTFAGSEALDTNGNGRVDTDEKPATPGDLYVYPLFTDALKKAVLDTTLGSDTAYYVPIKDPYGVPVGVLAVVESVSR
jgi:uncharacterized membrane protein (UPF0127 family)